MTRRNLLCRLLRLTGVLALCAHIPLSQAQDRAIRLIVPFPPGNSIGMMEVGKAVNEPAVRARLADLGLFPAAATPAQFGETIRKEIEKMQGLAKQTGISIE